MNKLKMAAMIAMIAMACSCPAFACQPPRDMPSEPQAQQEYWNRARTGWEKHAVNGAPTLVVAKVSLKAAGTQAPPSPEDAISAMLAPIKRLRGPFDPSAAGVVANHWCDDFKVAVADKGVYLLAMAGQRIILAVPLAVGQEQAGVSAFFTRIGEPNPWE